MIEQPFSAPDNVLNYEFGIGRTIQVDQRGNVLPRGFANANEEVFFHRLTLFIFNQMRL
jgi:hypothetical protein